MHGQIHVTLFTTYLLINEKYNSVFSIDYVLLMLKEILKLLTVDIIRKLFRKNWEFALEAIINQWVTAERKGIISLISGGTNVM